MSACRNTEALVGIPAGPAPSWQLAGFCGDRVDKPQSLCRMRLLSVYLWALAVDPYRSR